MLYYDRRGVSRVFGATFDGRKITFLREDPDMHQRMSLETGPDGLHLIAEASEDQGETWRLDLEMKYKRI